MEGICRNSHWPARYRKDGFVNWISITSAAATALISGKPGAGNTGARLSLHTIRMTDDAGNLGLSPGTHFAVQALNQVETASKELPAPTFVPQAVFPELLPGEGRYRVAGVAHETADGMSVEGEEEGNEQVVSVPERFEGLLPDLRVGGGVH